MRRIAVVAAIVLVVGCIPAGSGARPSTSAPTATAAATAAGSPAASSQPASRPEIWFGPMPPARPGHTDEIDGSADYDALFSGPDQWPVAARSTDVVSIISIWVFAFATDAQLKAIIESTAARGQRLALGMGALTWTQACGFNVEGFDATLDAVDRLHALGAHISVVAFDEPYFYGHRYTGNNACRWSTERVATEVASFVTSLRRSEPGLQVGDIEPLWGQVSAKELGEWLDAYRAASGANFDFLQLDVAWGHAAARDDVAATASEVAARGIKLGLIYNGPGGTSDKAWTDRARAGVAAAEARLGRPPDQAVFQSWEHWPRRALPETDPTTLTGLLRGYVVANGYTR